MSHELIFNALAKRLATFTPAMPIAMPNGAYKPVVGTAYLDARLLPNNPSTPSLRQTYSIERGFFQITVCFPSGKGSIGAIRVADALRAHFPAGLGLIELGQRVEVLGKPQIAPAMDAEGWYCLPVRVSYKALTA